MKINSESKGSSTEKEFSGSMRVEAEHEKSAVALHTACEGLRSACMDMGRSMLPKKAGEEQKVRRRPVGCRGKVMNMVRFKKR